MKKSSHPTTGLLGTPLVLGTTHLKRLFSKQIYTIIHSNKNNDSSFDSLTIYNGPDVETGVEIGQYCGTLGSSSNLPNENKIKSNGQDIFLRFTSDVSDADKGFRISYKEVCKFLIISFGQVIKF